MLMDPPCYLKSGNLVSVEIEGLGFIEDRVIEEPLPVRPGGLHGRV
jgi:hypothetical protein